MDPVHDRGSVDPVQSGGPWTPGPCFFLTLLDLSILMMGNVEFLALMPQNAKYVYFPPSSFILGGPFSSPEPLSFICNEAVALDAMENTNFFLG